MKKVLITRKYLILFALLLSFALLPACGGGGGGGGGFVGAGNVSISGSPNEIDVGDRTQVTLVISQASEDGIIVKIKFPEGLTYVKDSSFLTVDGSERDVGPQVNIASDNDIYLVYFFPNSVFDENGDGKLVFLLKGEDEVNNGKIEVDIDVDDPLIPNDSEFDVEDPQFQKEADISIKVES